jgi:hypothetical protein
MNPRVKKGLLGLAGLVGLVVVVLVAAFLTLDPKAMVQQKKDELFAQLSTKIGRTVKSGDVSASVGSSLSARIDALEVGGPKRDDGTVAPAQVQVGSVHVQLSLLRALLSFGRDLHVERFTVDGLVVRAARDADGRWDFQDIVDAMDSGEPDAPAEKSDGSALAGLRVASVLLRDARVELDDAVLGRPLKVEALNVGTSDVVPGKPLNVWLKADLVDQGRKSPIDLRVDLATLPPDFSFDPVPDVDVAAVVTDVDLAPWGGLLPIDSPGPVAGTLRVNATAGLKKNLEVIEVKGQVTTRGLVLRDALGATATKAERALAPRGAPADLDVNLDVALRGDSTSVKALSLKGVGADISGALEVQGGGLAGLKQAAVKGKVADLGRLLAILPPSLAALPPEVAIEGPLDLSLEKSGPTLKGGVVLDGARVRYLSTDDAGVTSASFDKAAGKALNLTLTGAEGKGTLDISDFALVIDTVKLGGKLSLPMDDKAPFSADVHSGAVSLASLQGLIPPFAAAIGRGQKVDGTVQIDVVATDQGGKQVADAAIALSNMDVNLEGTTVRGKGSLSVKASPGGDDVGIVAVADFDGLAVQKGSGADVTLNKPAGLPLRLDADVKKGKDAALINAVKLVIGKSSITGKGDVKGLGGKDERLALDFGTVDLAFNDLRQALPGASSLPAGGRLKGAVSLRGATAVEKLGVDVKNLDMVFGTSVLKGNVAVDNLDTPRLDIDLPTVNLAFDDLRGLSDSTADLPAGGRLEGTLKLKGDTGRLATMSVDATIKRLLAAKSDLSGTLSVKNLDKPQFTMTTQSDLLDVDALRAAFGGGDDDASTPPKKDENPSGLSKSTRDLLAGVNGRATMKAKRAIVKGMTMTDFNGVLVMTRGVAKFETLEFGFYGGTVTASGTLLDLPSEKTKYDLRLNGTNIDFGAVVAAHSPIGRVFKGTVSPKLEVKGRGLAPGDFAITADGPAALSFKQLIIGGLDVLGPIGDAMKAGKATGFNTAAAKKEPGLTLSNFTALTEFIGGKLKLQKPIEADTPMGKMKIEGTTGLDAKLDLRSTLQLTPQMIATMTGGKVKVKEPVPVPMKIGGTWDKPQVSGVDVKALLAAVVGDAAKDVIDKGKDAAKDAAEDAAKDALGNLLGGGKKKKKK